MDFFRQWLKGKRAGIFAFLLFCQIFFCAFALYHLPLGAVLYPALVCAVLGILLLGRDYRLARAKHRRLLEMEALPAELMDCFPQETCPEDGDYRCLIRALCREQAELRGCMDARYSDMIEYFTTWVHQIKTPIASMRLYLAGEDTDFSRKISEELLRIEQYVEMVLGYLRLDASDYVIQKNDLDSIIRQSLKKFSGQFYRKKLELSYEPLHVQVLTDEKWLAFVVEQVLSNALKYTFQGGVTISLEEPETLCIRDTGIGIAPEDLPRVFEKGYTGFNGRADKKASGIGLYLCRRICENLGHRITVESELYRGTMVRIALDSAKLEVE